ncbi:MAG: lipopolysaccharide biosynthesis protein [Bacteroidota bacterium]
MGGATISLRFISTVAAILLARILDPEDFGIVALAQILLSTTNLFSGLGLGPAIIQSRADRGKVAFQAFAATAVSGTVLFLVILANTGTFAGLLGNTDVVPVLSWMSAMVLFGALTIVPEALLQKDLLFGRVSITVVVSEVLYLAIALSMAYGGYGLWSLVYANLARGVIMMTLMWVLCPGWEWLKPKRWDRTLMRDLLRFGIHATGGGFITFFYSVADNLVVGKWLGAAALGFYSKSHDFTRRTVDQINNVIGAVLLPSYSKIQGDSERLSRAYLKSLRLVSFVTVPVAMGTLITAPEMIGTLLGEKWLPMVPALQVLACVSIVKPLSASTSALFLSIGRPLFNLKAGIVVTAVMIPLSFALLGFDIAGVAAAVLAAHFAGFAYNMYQVKTVMSRTASRMVPAAAPALIAAAVMMLGVHFSKDPLLEAVGGEHTLVSLGAMMTVGVLLYGGVLFLIQRSLVLEMLALAFSRFRPNRA